MDMQLYCKCGVQDGRFYDRIGDYFREGVDPRNSVGRFVNVDGWLHEFDCPARNADRRCNCNGARAIL